MFSRVVERELKRKAESWLDEGTDEALRPRQAPKTSLSAVVDNLRQLEEAIPWSNVVSSWEYKQKGFHKRLDELEANEVPGAVEVCRSLMIDIYGAIKRTALAGWWDGQRWTDLVGKSADAPAFIDLVEVLTAAVEQHAPPASWSSIGAGTPLPITQLKQAFSLVKQEGSAEAKAESAGQGLAGGRAKAPGSAGGRAKPPPGWIKLTDNGRLKGYRLREGGKLEGGRLHDSEAEPTSKQEDMQDIKADVPHSVAPCAPSMKREVPPSTTSPVAHVPSAKSAGKQRMAFDKAAALDRAVVGMAADDSDSDEEDESVVRAMALSRTLAADASPTGFAIEDLDDIAPEDAVTRHEEHSADEGEMEVEEEGEEEGEVEVDEDDEDDEDDEGDEDVYTVDCILKAKGAGKNRKYLVKWEGYAESEATWEPKANLHPDLVRDFERQQSSAAGGAEASAADDVRLQIEPIDGDDGSLSASDDDDGDDGSLSASDDDEYEDDGHEAGGGGGGGASDDDDDDDDDDDFSSDEEYLEEDDDGDVAHERSTSRGRACSRAAGCSRVTTSSRAGVAPLAGSGRGSARRGACGSGRGSAPSQLALTAPQCSKPTVLDAVWMQIDDESAEGTGRGVAAAPDNSAATSVMAVDSAFLSSLDAHDQKLAEEARAKQKLTLPALARLKEGAAAMKAFLAEQDEATVVAALAPAVKANVREAEVAKVRIVQFRALKVRARLRSPFHFEASARRPTCSARLTATFAHAVRSGATQVSCECSGSGALRFR